MLYALPVKNVIKIIFTMEIANNLKKENYNMCSQRSEGIPTHNAMLTFNLNRSCSKCSSAMIKISNKYCYNRCTGVCNSIFMLTRNYMIEYNLLTSDITHHYTSIGLGNGFAIASTSRAIYALGGNKSCSSRFSHIRSNSAGFYELPINLRSCLFH